MECWNSRFSKDAIHFKLYRQDEFCHLPNIAISQDPVFQYSSVPLFQLGEAPNLKLKETLFFILKSLRLLRSLWLAEPFQNFGFMLNSLKFYH